MKIGPRASIGTLMLTKFDLTLLVYQIIDQINERFDDQKVIGSCLYSVFLSELDIFR